MNPEFRRVLVAMLAAMAVFIGYQFLVNSLFPRARQQSPTTPPAPAVEEQEVETQPVATGSEPSVRPSSSRAVTTREGPTLSLSAAPESGPLVLGGRDGDALKVELHPLGATLASLRLYAKDAKGRFIDTTRAEVNEPYELLSPVSEGGSAHFSYGTYRVWIKEFGDRSWRLDENPWQVAKSSPDEVSFATELTGEADQAAHLRFTKTYVLRPGKPVIDLRLTVENLGPQALTIWVEQDGPIGMPQQNSSYDMRALLCGFRGARGVEMARGYHHDKLLAATKSGEPIRLWSAEKGPLLWTALSDKYFAVFTRPLPVRGDTEDWVSVLTGQVAVVEGDPGKGDLLARLTSKPQVVAGQSAVTYPLEIYAGAKDAAHLERVDPAYADKSQLNYQLTRSADSRCFCTFLWLEDLMVWLLEKIHSLLPNYGVAIIILVIIVRGLLHPLSVWQQKSMFRMQEVMGRLQPRLNELKERYANDKVKQNQEMMKVFAEENVNPASNFVSFIPMFIQMPILVALWTGLNTNVNLRHAPFDGWWIRDLSSPDALIGFDPPFTVPILSAIPLLGSVFTNMHGLNLLPILMGISMWLQQKYMPKPHMQARAEAARKQPTSTKGGMTPEQQMRQQQIMMYVMSVLFPLMFYTMPSGLNLYWMATNVFGIAESLIIRKQIDEERKRRAEGGPPPPRKPGLVARFFKHVASQAEELQRKADELAKTEGRGKDDRKGRKKS